MGLLDRADVASKVAFLSDYSPWMPSGVPTEKLAQQISAGVTACPARIADGANPA